jgi:hypothetical protein
MRNRLNEINIKTQITNDSDSNTQHHITELYERRKKIELMAKK